MNKKIDWQDVVSGACGEVTIVYEKENEHYVRKIKDMAMTKFVGDLIMLYDAPVFGYTATMVLDAMSDYKSFFRSYYDVASDGDQDVIYKKIQLLDKFLEINDFDASDIEEFHYSIIEDKEMQRVVKHTMMHYPFFRIDKMFDAFYNEDVIIVGDENSAWAKEMAKTIEEYYFPHAIFYIDPSENPL